MEPSPSHEILSYLLEHSDAQDTLEGIAQWWCLERSVQRRVHEVRKAMDDLLAKDFVVAKQGKDSVVRYQINRGKLNEIKSALAGNETMDVPRNRSRGHSQKRGAVGY